MNLLSIETATDVCGVAVFSDDHKLAEIQLERPRSHAEFLVPMIEQVLRLANLSPRDVTSVAVSVGPGSYTGLRIGVSTAKGFAFGTGAQIVGVPSLEALALDTALYADEGNAILAGFLARRDEAFAGLWQVGHGAQGEQLAQGSIPGTDMHLNVLRETAAVPREELWNWVNELGKTRIWAVGGWWGTDVPPYPKISEQGVGLRFVYHRPSAAAVGRLGLRMLARGARDDVSSLEPYYLKEFIAKKQLRSIFERLRF